MKEFGAILILIGYALISLAVLLGVGVALYQFAFLTTLGIALWNGFLTWVVGIGLGALSLLVGSVLLGKGVLGKK